jgi:lipopolysaccharide exporter
MNIQHAKKIIFSLRENGGSLSQRAVKSSFWVFFLRMTQQLLGFARLIILARVLAPNDFGLMGISLLMMSTLETFSQTGLQQALIQKKEEINSYLDTVWTFSIFRGAILFGVLYMIAPYAAIFFDSPEAKPIIQVIGISIILKAFTNIGVIYFQKELEFNKQYIYQLSGTVSDFVVSVILVLLLGNIWALVYGLIAGNIAMLIISYLIHPYRPHLNFNFRKVKELFGYGKWVMWSTILAFLVTQGDDILVGKILSATALGLYQMSYKISNLPATEITHVISQVTFPLYSKIQDDDVRLRESYLKVFQFITFVSFPITGLIFVLSSDFTTLFLGDKWLQMVPSMKILVLEGLVRSIAASSGNLFYAMGKTKIDTKLQVIRFILLVTLIYPLTIKWGIFGTSIAVFFSISISCIGFSIITLKIIKCSLKRCVSILLIPLFITLLVSIFMTMLKNMLATGLFEFAFLSIVGILLYGFILLVLDNKLNYNIKDLLKESKDSLIGV